MNMNMDFIKGFSVGIAILILYVFFLQPQTGRYVFHNVGTIILDTKTGQTFSKGGVDNKWKKYIGIEKG